MGLPRMAGVARPPPNRSGLIVAATGFRHPRGAERGDDAERALRIVHRHSPDIEQTRSPATTPYRRNGVARSLRSGYVRHGLAQIVRREIPMGGKVAVPGGGAGNRTRNIIDRHAEPAPTTC
jgi:hypothetical protein